MFEIILVVAVVALVVSSYVVGMRVGWRKAMDMTECYIPWRNRTKAYFWLDRWI